jgi:arylsulfatase A-like enzyme
VLTRRGFLASASAFAQRPSRPNIVVIVSDDHGYNEIGPQGGDIPTPNIDAIARNGVRFTNGYVSCPVCSPTRAGIMTGRYQQRFGHEFNPGPDTSAAPNFGLPLSEKTLADQLKALGYQTGMVGKWHLGYRPEYHPRKRGFDEFFGFLGGAHPYLPGRPDRLILRGTEPVAENEYLTEAFTREAVAFLKRRREQPFFLYLTYNAVHAPMEAIGKYRSRFSGIADERRGTFAAMLSALDDGVGAVRAALKESGAARNTLVFFVADNGGPTNTTTSRNHPLRGFKAQAYEGGIRVPFLAEWPDRIPGNKTFDQPVISLDILPTAVAAAGARPPANVDGVDLLPHITGKASSPPHDALYWRFGQQRAIRQGDWKLLTSAGRPWELYNLRADIGEANDLAAAEPQRRDRMLAAWNQWSAQMAEPAWQPRANARAKAGRKKGD